MDHRIMWKVLVANKQITRIVGIQCKNVLHAQYDVNPVNWELFKTKRGKKI